MHRSSPRLVSIVLVSLPALAVTFVTAGALDTTLDYRDSHQTARSADGTFSSYFRRESATARQVIQPVEPLTLSLRFRILRETFGGDASGADQETERRSYQPDATLNWRQGPLEVGLEGSILELRNEGTTALAPEATRHQVGGWLNTELPMRGRLTSSVTRTGSEDRGLIGQNREQSQTTGQATYEQPLGDRWDLEYGLRGSTNDLTNRGTRRTIYRHSVDVSGTPEMVDERLDTFVRARSQFFFQTVETGLNGSTALQLTPLLASYAIDDTPETLDPLEDDPLREPLLTDGDRESPTSIDLGADAVVGREFGGDYRNLILDFGTTQTFESAIVYLDRRLLNPELFQWRAFVTDDPDGRLWDELEPARAAVAYREWGNLFQGFEATFADDVSGRYLKLVNVKLGPSVPVLPVTELEVFSRVEVEATETDDHSQDHRVETRLAYDVSQRTRVGYDGALRLRFFEDDARDATEHNHGVHSTHRRGPYRFSGRVDVHTLSSDTRRNTDVVTYGAAITRRETNDLYGTLAWTRTDDSGAGRDQTTHDIALSSSWRTAPGFRLTQRLAHGRRDDASLNLRSRSWSVTHRVISSPTRTTSLTVHRTDRWADVDAGSGFQNYSDTGLDVLWTPVPLVQLASNTQIQDRSDTEWTSRNWISWTPFPNRTLETTLSGDTFLDSREESVQYGGGVRVRWRPRVGLLAEFGVTLRRYEVDGIETNPVSSQIHVNWTR